jgi:hypothetical protein
MRRTTISTSLISLFVTSMVSTASIPAIAAPRSPVPIIPIMAGNGLIQEKQPVPDDPLAGLPSDDSSRRRPGRSGSTDKNKSTACAVKVTAANDRDIGDLRATLAFVKLGPRSWPCPPRSARAELRLRITIDGDGKVTAAEPVAGDTGVADAIIKKFTGKSITPRAEGGTVGIVVLTFASSK